MPIHACTATVLLIAYCHAHLGRLPPATTRICRVRTHSVAAWNFQKFPVSTPFLVGATHITSVRRSERLPSSSRRSFSSTGWRGHGIGTMPSPGATFTLPHPCPSSSPLSICRDGCFRLHRVLSVIEANRPRDARRIIRCSAIFRRVRARVCISLHRSSFAATARWTDCR